MKKIVLRILKYSIHTFFYIPGTGFLLLFIFAFLPDREYCYINPQNQVVLKYRENNIDHIQSFSEGFEVLQKGTYPQKNFQHFLSQIIDRSDTIVVP